MSRTIIIGGGQAGGRCAMTLRTKGYDGEIILAGDEEHAPYRRPPLSKAVLLGASEVEDGYLRPLTDYAGSGIELRLGCRVERVDTGDRTVVYDDGGVDGFDHLVFATGATPRKLPLPGHQLDGVMLLRTAGQALAIRERLRPGNRVVIVGGGFIGLEVAASARQCGCDVTVLETQERVLGRSLPEQAAAAVARVHHEQGVSIRCGVALEAFAGDDRVRTVILTGGESLEADLVVVGIGITPNVSLAREAGIDVADGITTDEYARTSVERVYAAGDCASSYMPRYGRHIRLESFQNADQQGANAAATIAGQPAGYDPVPFVWSDQYHLVLQTAGFPAEGDVHVQRGSADDENLVLFSLKDRRLVGVTGWGIGRGIARDIRSTQSLIQQDIHPDAGQLADPGVAIKDLAATS